MRFYSGFALKDDASHFREWLDSSEYTVAGFSYGAIEAFEHVFDSKNRIDRLQLFSPAFFQTKKERFIHMQLNAYRTNESSYIQHFLDNCFYPAINDRSQNIGIHSLDRLERLLNYEWSHSKLSELKKRGVTIDVYLGGNDKIIDSMKAFDFFSTVATVYLYKEAGHFLKT